MTGIAGCLVLAPGTRPDTDWAVRATTRMAHRGTDDDGVFADGHVALSARRMTVHDPLADGPQPMRSADGRYSMVYDGTIYNCDSLAEKLRAAGVRLRGTSDAEILVEMYAIEGKDILRQLRGMYAFAIWDARERELFCARDPFGLKPLYYALADDGRQLRFSSERKALASPGDAPPSDVPPVDPDALRRYLSFQYVPAPSTMTPPVRSMPPGHFMIAKPGAPVDVFRYWRPVLRPSRSPAADTPEKILDALRESVTVHMRGDDSVGAFLSGGVDSAAICAIAAQTRPGLLTFTAGFEREGYSEIEEAQDTAAALGLRNIPYVITAQEFVKRLPQIIWQLDDPLADAAAVAMWFIAREASRHVDVVLSGEGADELFGGYGVYYQPAAVRAATRVPGLAQSAGALAARMSPGQRGKGLLHRVATPLRDRYIGNANVFTVEDVDALTKYGDGTVFDVTDPLFDQAAESSLDDVATMQLVDINTWLPGDVLVKADRATMAHGLELRAPFLDREVMAVASRLARAEKTAAGTTKFALREAVGGLLPREAAERPTLGFPVPLGEWFHDELAGFPEHVIKEAATDQWLDKRSALDVARRFRGGDPDVSWRQVWSLVVFSLWHQIYVEQVFDPAGLGWESSSRERGSRERGAGDRDLGDRAVTGRRQAALSAAPAAPDEPPPGRHAPAEPRPEPAEPRRADPRRGGSRHGESRHGEPRHVSEEPRREPRPRDGDRDRDPREPDRRMREPRRNPEPQPAGPAFTPVQRPPAGPAFTPAQPSSGQPRPSRPPSAPGQARSGDQSRSAGPQRPDPQRPDPQRPDPQRPDPQRPGAPRRGQPAPRPHRDQRPPAEY